MMNTWRIALVLMVTSALVSGCAKPDWVEQTLVTVDVTGTWLAAEGIVFELNLEQHGQKVTGSVSRGPVGGQAAVEGTVSGDVFRFSTVGPSYTMMQGDMTVSGDDMNGDLRAPSRVTVHLRRVSTSPRQSQQ